MNEQIRQAAKVGGEQVEKVLREKFPEAWEDEYGVELMVCDNGKLLKPFGDVVLYDKSWKYVLCIAATSAPMGQEGRCCVVGSKFTASLIEHDGRQILTFKRKV